MIAASFRTSARAEQYGVLVAGAECVSSACSDVSQCPCAPITVVGEPRSMKSQLSAIPKQLAWTPWIERLLDRAPNP
jgi:hypothetical protein